MGFGVGPNRIEKQVSKGFDTSEVIWVRSSDVARIEKASREITSLLEQGVSITSEDPLYHYTKLGELMVEMLARVGAGCARTRRQHSALDGRRTWEAPA